MAQICLLLLLVAVPALAQTATTGAVAGTLTDASGALVAGAIVELKSPQTGSRLATASDAAGNFLLANVAPGEYTLGISATNFRNYLSPAFTIVATREYRHDVRLEVGAAAETLTVSANGMEELSTSATVGNALEGSVARALPVFTRQANELLTLQPGATPAGETAGARADQITFTLDRIDVTNNSFGGLGSYLYLGVEGRDEFRVSIANPHALFGRGGGAQVALISRRATNDVHANAFWFHQNDNLNANSWTNNRIGLRPAETKDHRSGFLAAAPLRKDRTFALVNFEARRFPRSSTITRIVPTESLRQGTLRFRDSAGNLGSYPLASSRACGPNGDLACDPRGLGLSPTINALFRALPAGNNPAEGDGLNTIGFTSIVSHPLSSDNFNARLDHRLSSRWTVEAALRYFRQSDESNTALDIRGGAATSIRNFPLRQNYEALGLRGQLTQRLSGEFRFGRVRNRTALDALRPSASSAALGLPGSITPAGPVAFDLGA
jgi:hypothetical protein